jgi:RHS repeat-associated protein
LFANFHFPTSSFHAPAFDGNGNIVAYVDMATGNRSATYEYGAFGEALIADGPLADAFMFRFSTKYLDAETGLYYYGYRYYNTATGRWINKDPLHEQGGVNLYAYVGNRVTSFFDTDGRLPFSGMSADSWGGFSGLLGPGGPSGARAAQYRQQYPPNNAAAFHQLTGRLNSVWNAIVDHLPITPRPGFNISFETPVGFVGPAVVTVTVGIEGSVTLCCAANSPGKKGYQFEGSVYVAVFIGVGLKPAQLNVGEKGTAVSLTQTGVAPCTSNFGDITFAVSIIANAGNLGVSYEIGSYSMKNGLEFLVEGLDIDYNTQPAANIGIEGKGSGSGSYAY